MTTALVILSLAIAACGTLCLCKMMGIRIRIDVETYPFIKMAEDSVRFGDDDDDDDDGDSWKKSPGPSGLWSDSGRG